MLSRVTYVTLFVSDQDSALEFYLDTLGFERREENPAGRVPFVTIGLKDQDLQIALWPGTPGKADPGAGPIPGTCIIDTTDLAGDFAHLKAQGVEFIEPEPVTYPNGAGYVNFVDPDGNRLSLRQQPA
jgi:catechol 2,3-dioxygenase-like lactoylglutathione lyase family enzyme